MYLKRDVISRQKQLQAEGQLDSTIITILPRSPAPVIVCIFTFRNSMLR